jgi:hypothetical protein
MVSNLTIPFKTFSYYIQPIVMGTSNGKKLKGTFIMYTIEVKYYANFYNILGRGLQFCTCQVGCSISIVFNHISCTPKELGDMSK